MSVKDGAAIGIDGIRLTIDEEAVHLSSESPLIVCSSAVVGGGLSRLRHIVNMHVPNGYDGREPEEELRSFASRRGIVEPFVGLLTAAWTHEAKLALEENEEIRVAAVATVGLSNAVAAGLSPAAVCAPSTINTIVVIDAELPPGALVNAVITATEAKSLALRDAGIKTAQGFAASGTSTDAVVVAATGRGRRLRYAGPVSDGGWLIARAVRRAVEAGISGAGER